MDLHGVLDPARVTSGERDGHRNVPGASLLEDQPVASFESLQSELQPTELVGGGWRIPRGRDRSIAPFAMCAGESPSSTRRAARRTIATCGPGALPPRYHYRIQLLGGQGKGESTAFINDEL